MMLFFLLSSSYALAQCCVYEVVGLPINCEDLTVGPGEEQTAQMDCEDIGGGTYYSEICSAIEICTIGECTDNIIFRCADGTDITTANCMGGILYPTGQTCPEEQVESCLNNAKDVGETDVDCGGDCSPCTTGKSCITDSDCTTENCAVGTCATAEVPVEEIPEEEPEVITPADLRCGNGVCDIDETQETCVYDCGFCGDNKLVNEECETDADCYGGKCDACECIYSCTDDNLGRLKPLNLVVSNSRGEIAVNLLWTLDTVASGCMLNKMMIFRCKTSATGQCEPKSLVGQMEKDARSLYNYRDIWNIEPYTRYCYKVTAYYKEEGTAAQSNVACAPLLPEDDCMKGSNFMCNENVLYSCGAQNERVFVQNCSTIPSAVGKYYCLGPDEGGNAECVLQNNCNMCNGLFGLFGIMEDTSETLHILTSASGSKTAGRVLCTAEFVRSCFIDHTKTNVDKYNYCGNITSCYQYRSMQACDTNLCKIGDCSWSESDTAGAEFGFGVCVPKDKDKEDCSLCSRDNSPARNNFFGRCSDSVCRIYGDCYYTNIMGGYECSSKQSIGCRSFKTKNDCINADQQGEQNAVLDVVYDAQGNRIGGTNRIITKSNDYFSYGTCKWGSDFDAQACVKDADGDNKLDCDIYDVVCQADNTPPATTIVPQVPMEGERLLLGTEVYLKLQTTEPALTYFCFVKDEGTSPYCYPKESTACGIQKKVGPGEQWYSGSGNYILYYYSEDRAHNLEEVKSLKVKFDDSVPDISVAVSKPNPKTRTFIISTNMDVTCSAHLENSVGVMLYPENMIDKERIASGRSISRSYINLDDDDYYFIYECENRAGNKRTGEKIAVIDTNNIYDPSPRVPVPTNAVDISVKTKKAASCRYAITTGTEQRYDDMEDQFLTGDGLTHTAVALVVPGEFYSFDVKCKMTDGTIEGEKNDRIIFSVDNVPPTITAVSTFDALGFDQTQEYGTKQTLMLQCKDDWFLKTKGIRGMDFGCDETIFSYTDSSGNARDGNIFLGDGLSPPFTVDATQTIGYTTKDKGGNYISGAVSVRINTAPPLLYLDVIKSPLTDDSRALDAVSYGDYILKLTSSRSLIAAEAGISIFGDDIIYDIPVEYISSDDFGRTHYFAFSVPWTIPQMTENVLGANVTAVVARPGEFCSVEIALDENKHYRARNFTFDTGIPEAELKPKLDTYHSVYSYPLNEEEGIYYTNQNPLFITGASKTNATVRVNYYVGQRISEMRLQQSYDLRQNAQKTPMVEMKPGNFQGNTGDNKAINYIGGLTSLGVTEGNFIKFEDARRAYGYYDNYYTIDKVKGNEITFVENLEKEVELADTAQVFDKPTPYNWFGADIELERGANYFFFRPESRGGLEGYLDKIYTIVYDPDPPEVISSVPNEGQVSNPNTPISIIVKESRMSSQLDTKSIKLYLNGKPNTIAEKDIKITSDGQNNYYNITYKPGKALNGTYYVNFTGYDLALNPLTAASASPEWIFTVNKDSPDRPIFDVAGGTFYNGMWFVKKSPVFTLYFPDAVPVDITGYHKNYAPNFINADNCKGTAESNFFKNCMFNPALQPRVLGGGSLIEDEFQIIVQARKIFSARAYGPNSLIYLDKLVIDDQVPSIGAITHPEKIAQNIDVKFDAIVYNEAHDLNATLLFNGKNYPLSQTGKSDNNNHFYFNWETPEIDYSDIALKAELEGEHDIILRIADYAGNAATYSGKVYLDLTPPDVDDLDVAIMPTRVISNNEFQTKQTEIIVKGNFTESDVSSVYVMPGDYRFAPGQKPVMEDISELANIEGHKFELNMIINGTFNRTILNELNLFMEDEAGNIAITQLYVVADMQPPYVVGTTVT
ncbi:MAG: hypothetical protein KKE20_02705 [Nanoarchaeota archaeon]|nr:hypothetical protein [Nanoarchaeota archaeon]